MFRVQPISSQTRVHELGLCTYFTCTQQRNIYRTNHRINNNVVHPSQENQMLFHFIQGKFYCNKISMRKRGEGVTHQVSSLVNRYVITSVKVHKWRSHFT